MLLELMFNERVAGSASPVSPLRVTENGDTSIDTDPGSPIVIRPGCTAGAINSPV